MIGLIFANDAPTAAPVHADSETGVSMTLSLPNFLSKFVIEFPTYQGLQSPCPITKTSGLFSRRYSNAARIAVP